jgi:hypothetical protein
VLKLLTASTASAFQGATFTAVASSEDGQSLFALTKDAGIERYQPGFSLETGLPFLNGVHTIPQIGLHLKGSSFTINMLRFLVQEKMHHSIELHKASVRLESMHFGSA